MDVISFSEAATANSRIEIINANPDSSSGIVTVPKVIATGESVTIPAGRVAVLPNVQVDGVLNIEGEVFIPSGATLGDLDAQLALKAPLVNPAFTNPTATTQEAQDNSTKVATTAYVDGKMVRGTSVTASGTSIDFTGIPSWSKRVTVMFNGVSTNGTSIPQIQLGDSGGVENSGYLVSTSGLGATTVGTSSVTSGFSISNSPHSAGYTFSGQLILSNLSGNLWVISGNLFASTNVLMIIVGMKTLSAILERIRITTANGTDSFDAGQINIMYEG